MQNWMRYTSARDLFLLAILSTTSALAGSDFGSLRGLCIALSGLVVLVLFALTRCGPKRGKNSFVPIYDLLNRASYIYNASEILLTELGKLLHVSVLIESWEQVLRAGDIMAMNTVPVDIGLTCNSVTRG